MKRKLAVACATFLFSTLVAISIIAGCGSTWVAQAPTFGPSLGTNGCTVNSNPTVTSKSVETTIHWTVGPPSTLVITDSGENKAISTGVTSTCIRCFPTFNTPEWIELSNENKTEWRQFTYAQFVTPDNTCAERILRGAINHHLERTCGVTEEECELEFNWFWNPVGDSCQEDGPPSCDLLPEVCENGQWSLEWCGCVDYPTPILVDISGNGFNLTKAADGVTFNADNKGGKEKLAWTSSHSDDAWLVLDRNSNGTIDDGTELFGNVADQPEPPADQKKNGFIALAEYDKVSKGGNGDGQIDRNDAVFSDLRLWQDTNHDGVSESTELHTLPSLNVATFELDYKTAKKTDGNGNQFSFRAKIKNSQGQQLGRWAWDVYLVKAM